MSKIAQELSAALESVVAASAPSVVSVRSHRLQASGFAWRTGLVVTSNEGLAEDEGEVRLTLPGGKTAPAQVVGRDPSTAIALLRTEASELPAAVMAASIPAPGALTVAVGAEEGAPAASIGMVSVSRGPWQSMRGGDIDARIELNVRLRRSGEGGLAVNAAGEAFGMTVLGPRRRVLVIPSSTIARVAAMLKTHGRIPRGYLGLGLQAVTAEAGGSGLMAMSVDPVGPGAAADIHQGDVLVSWDGKSIGSLQPLLRSLGPGSVGKSVAIEFRRGGKTHQAKLQIGERPAA